MDMFKMACVSARDLAQISGALYGEVTFCTLLTFLIPQSNGEERSRERNN